jgi:hypothetical protein
MSRRSNGARPRVKAQPVVPARTAEDHMVDVLDELTFFQEFKAELLPDLRKLIAGGAPTKDILERARALATARLASLAALETDSRTALVAIKELMDRLDGKATERKEIKHSMEQLRDEELDALVMTAMKDVSE